VLSDGAVADRHVRATFPIVARLPGKSYPSRPSLGHVEKDGMGCRLMRIARNAAL
jgi:hypothetical protein